MKRLLILLCPFVQLAAEELLVRDLRLGVGMCPTDFSYSTSDPQATTSGDDALDSAYAASLRLSWSWSGAGRAWAPIVAGEALAERAAYGADGTYEQYVLRGLAGLGWQVGDDWSFSALALVGVGRPSFSVPIATGGTISTAGASASTGILLGVRYALSRHWSVDVEAGWVEEAATLSGDEVDLDLNRSGASVGLGLTWSWSRQPVRLE